MARGCAASPSLTAAHYPQAMPFRTNADMNWNPFEKAGVECAERIHPSDAFSWRLRYAYADVAGNSAFLGMRGWLLGWLGHNPFSTFKVLVSLSKFSGEGIFSEGEGIDSPVSFSSSFSAQHFLQSFRG